MLANTYYQKKIIDNYKREIFLKFILELRVYVTHSLTKLYLEVIANIQC